jgi:hypothetical protein
LPADDPLKQAALTAAQAGQDFEIQGEYSGTLATDDGDLKFGVQVIALGDGSFRAVAYPGGLPGDGWSGEDRHEVDGELEGTEAVFDGENGRGVIRNGELIVEGPDGRELGRLKKVARKSPTLGKKPLAGAVVLFDGEKKVNRFPGAKVAEDGLLVQGATSEPRFQDFTLHLEFLLSFMPQARGQARANSGCYMQGRYEVQILDSFGLEGKHNECAGIYEVKAPSVNMCFPPLSWQTYDVEFTAPRFDENGKKTSNARMTVRHNGVLVHENVEVPGPTRAAPNKEGSEPGPIFLQDHGNPIRFRNVWVLEKK